MKAKKPTGAANKPNRLPIGPARSTARRFLFIHQNFPGQFRHVAAALADDPKNTVVGLGSAERVKVNPNPDPRIRVYGYKFLRGESGKIHHYLREYQDHIRRGQAVVRALLQLRKRGFLPDVIVAHPGWGEALFLREVFPKARVLLHCEFFYQGVGADLGFDPEFPSTFDQRAKVQIRNSTQLVSLASADGGISPTAWQRERYPADFQPKIVQLHEGIDSNLVRPDRSARLELAGQSWTSGEEIVTYVARNLEPYRGFHLFMRSLPELLAARPKVRVVVAGGDGVSYGRAAPNGKTYQQHLAQELGNTVDWNRVFFVGHLRYPDYLKLLQVSACHVYLTYPFVLSWSMMEAMSSGCAVVASDTAPVRELVEHNKNGMLVDFFDVKAISAAVAALLDDRSKAQKLGAAARNRIVKDYDLQTTCLPKWLEWVTGNEARGGQGKARQ